MSLKNMNAELKKVVSRVKSAQAQLQSLVQDRAWMDEARKYAERQGEEVKKLIHSDVTKLKGFLEREKKELEKLQKQLPAEVEKLRSFVADQKRELHSLISTVRGAVKSGAKSRPKTRAKAKKKPTAKKRAARKPAASSASSS